MIVKNIFENNKLIVNEDDYGKISIFQKNPNGVVILANDHGHFILIEQFRAPVASIIVQLPGGGVEHDESIEVAARREFKEETGYECGEVSYLGNLLPASWRSNEVTHVYYTEDILHHAEQQLEAHENISVIKMKVSDCIEQIKNNEIKDSELCYAILQAKLKGFIT